VPLRLWIEAASVGRRSTGDQVVIVAHATAMPSAAEPMAGPAGELPAPLGRAFAALDEGGGAWALLRAGADLATADEVDVLVSRSALEATDRALATAGFVRLRSPGRGSHRFFAGYDAAADRWVKLDLVSELDFGRYQELATDLAEDWLGRRDSGARPPRLDPDDAFWAFLLHALLDRRRLRPGDGPRLHALAETARVDSPAAAAIGTLLPPGWTAARVIDAARATETAGLDRLRDELRRAWLRRVPLAVGGRWLGHRAARRFGPALAGLVSPGPSVALLAPDGAGKTTLADALETSFPIPVRRVYLGLYGRGAGGGPRGPRGRLGLPGRLAWLWRRWLGARWQQARGCLVVFDRHVLDLALTAPGASRRARSRRRLLVRSCPTPDLVLVLDVPGEELYRRKGEHDPARLERERQGYLELARRLPRARVIDAAAEPELVRRRAVAAIWSACAERQSG
jgi:hypothetical protein